MRLIDADNLISVLDILMDKGDDIQMWEQLKSVVASCPTIEPEPCEDAVSREAVSKWLKQYGQDVLHGKYKFSLMYIWKNLMDLPPAQPERHLCRECVCVQYYGEVDKHGNVESSWYCCNWDNRTDEEGFCHEWRGK